MRPVAEGRCLEYEGVERGGLDVVLCWVGLVDGVYGGGDRCWYVVSIKLNFLLCVISERGKTFGSLYFQ